MEKDKEPEMENSASSEKSDGRGASGKSRSGRGKRKASLRFPYRSLFEEYWQEARRQIRRARRVLATQFGDLNRAFLDLKSRIRTELDPDAPRPENKSKRAEAAAPVRAIPGKESQLKENPHPAPTFSIRPAGLPEQVTKLRRILVVGGMDFFGAALVRHFNQRGVREIVIADTLEDERWKNVTSLRFEDFLSLEEFAANLGSRVRGPGSFSHVFYLAGWGGQEAPLALPKSLLSHVADSGGRLISLSSACSLGPTPNRRDLALGRPENLRPETRPGVVANLFDRFAMARLPGGNFLSLKHYRLFGPHERRDDSIYGLVKMVQDQIAQTGSALLPENFRPGSLEGVRRHDFLSVGEAVNMAVFLAESEESEGQYEIGSGTSSTVAELVQAVFEVLGRPPVIDWSQSPAAIPSPQPEKADLSRLREAGWTEPEPSLREGLRKYLEDSPDEDLPLDEEAAEAEEDEEAPATAASGKILIAPIAAPARILPARRRTFSPKTTS